MGRWIFLVLIMAIFAGAREARGEMLQTLQGKVVRVGSATMDVRSGDRVVTLTRDPTSMAGSVELKIGDDVVVTYVLEAKEVKNLRLKDRQKAGEMPAPQPQKQEDDRIFYDA